MVFLNCKCQHGLSSSFNAGNLSLFFKNIFAIKKIKLIFFNLKNKYKNIIFIYL
jgi:hypothetical protein